MQTSEIRAALVPTILPTMDYGQRERHMTSHQSWKGDPKVLGPETSSPPKQKYAVNCCGDLMGQMQKKKHVLDP